MNDEMIDLMAGDVRLRRRLEAYAGARLSPDLSATSRMRARVLAHAHRQADLARADAALTIVTSAGVPVPDRRRYIPRRRGARLSRLLALAAAAALVVAVAGGAAATAGPATPLYGARLWLEEVSLPGEPSQRALAELGRLEHRVREAEAAAVVGDLTAAAAALAAYERIADAASTSVVAAGDPVAAAVLETGVGRNVEVLAALVERVPGQASDTIGRALENAIERSGTAIDRVGDVKNPRPNPVAAPADPTPKPTRSPDPHPTPKPTKAPPDANDPGGAGKPDARPTSKPQPAKTPKNDR